MFLWVRFICVQIVNPMALKTFVKISNISNLSDTRYCAGMMVDILGFNIDATTDDFVSADDFAEITDWVTGVQFAGEFHSAGLDEIADALKKYPVDLVEIASIDLVEQVQLLGKKVIFRLDVNSTEELESMKSNLSYLDELVSYVVLHSNDESLFDEIDAQIGYYNGNTTLLKGFGITPSPQLSKYPGLELTATEEERPGFKDYGQIMDVLECIEED